MADACVCGHALTTHDLAEDCLAQGCPCSRFSAATPSPRVEVEHRLTVKSVCPVDGTADSYNCLITLSHVVAVEHILDAVEHATREPIFQEDLTKKLAVGLNAEVVTHGIHWGVYTSCRCSA